MTDDSPFVIADPRRLSRWANKAFLREEETASRDSRVARCRAPANWRDDIANRLLAGA